MAELRQPERQSERGTEPPTASAESLGGTYWSVDDGRWANVQPALPAELIELLAPPILVGVTRVPPPVAAGGRPRPSAS